jgi:hypothetical protein
MRKTQFGPGAALYKLMSSACVINAMSMPKRFFYQLRRISKSFSAPIATAARADQQVAL